jgi:ribonuclease R
MSPNRLREKILRVMDSRDYRPMNKSEFVRHLEIPTAERPMLRNILHKLDHEGLIESGKKGRFQLVRPAAAEDDEDAGELNSDHLCGAIKFTPKGHAWFFPDAGHPHNKDSDHDFEAHSRIYVPGDKVARALDGDRVLVSLHMPKPSGKSPRGRKGGRPDAREPELRAHVETILDRRSGQLVGIYQQGGGKGWAKIDDPAYSGTIDIPGETTARPGQIVVVEIEDWRGDQPRGKVLEVLGWPDESGVDILSIIHRNGIVTSFPQDVLDAAREIPAEVDSDEAGRREDWRDRLVFTIDPEDAKDFDDALWVEKTKTGWQLAVHIADVSHYVKPDSALDTEALKRGNSTYLVDRVIPMLPVELSNGLCSLKPQVDRLTKCAVLDVDRKGQVTHSRFCNAVIHSKARLTYEQAQTILDGGKAPEGAPKEVAAKVREAWKMAETLRKRRFADGALDLEMPEIRVLIGDDGRASGIENVEHTTSHQLVEECMLAANEFVAKELKRRNKPAIHRIHDEPDFSRLQEYGETAKQFGYRFGDLTNKKHIQQLLDAAKGKPDEHAIKIGLLKSLKRAAYSPDGIGHYGLSKSDYCHFTSPIRRYADLVIHRALQPFLSNPPKPVDRTPSQAALGDIARHISDTERASSDSENESKQVKLLEYLEDCGKAETPVVFEGLITDVRAMGLMVEATNISTRGVIKREDLPGGGRWRFEGSQSRLVGPDGTHYQLGQRIRMQIARIDHEHRFVDFRIAGEDGKPTRSASGRGRRATGGSRERRGGDDQGKPKGKSAKKAAGGRRSGGKTAAAKVPKSAKTEGKSSSEAKPKSGGRRRRSKKP